jgi:two-component system OmpR family response regulator
MLHRGRILVVDDEPELRELMTLALEAEGYRVLVADNDAPALELPRHDRVDAIVLDMMMPTLDGWGDSSKNAEH